MATSNFCSGEIWEGEGVVVVFVALLFAREMPNIITPPINTPKMMANMTSLRIVFPVSCTITGITSEVNFVLICF